MRFYILNIAHRSEAEAEGGRGRARGTGEAARASSWVLASIRIQQQMIFVFHVLVKNRRVSSLDNSWAGNRLQIGPVGSSQTCTAPAPVSSGHRLVLCLSVSLSLLTPRCLMGRWSAAQSDGNRTCTAPTTTHSDPDPDPDPDSDPDRCLPPCTLRHCNSWRRPSGVKMTTPELIKTFDSESSELISP